MPVIHIAEAPSDWKDNPEYVYIGRAGYGLDGYFGNPFRLLQDTPEERSRVYLKFLDWAIERIQIDSVFKDKVRGLYGKVLVCFCKPKLCHGDVLESLAGLMVEE